NEVQKFINKTEHVRSWIYLVISEITWNKLSDADKAAVMEAGKRAQAFERAAFLTDEKNLVAELEGKGVTFVEVDGAAFASKAKDAVLANVKPEIKSIVEGLFAE
ncbi:MAG: C4-dicarboxylate ABC transporter, partial [Rhizobiales bacterium]|nr:C4-dicarboxylate ABC transporter [Hyphomicrobiales bacterium]